MFFKDIFICNRPEIRITLLPPLKVTPRHSSEPSPALVRFRDWTESEHLTGTNKQRCVEGPAPIEIRLDQPAVVVQQVAERIRTTCVTNLLTL